MPIVVVIFLLLLIGGSVLVAWIIVEMKTPESQVSGQAQYVARKPKEETSIVIAKTENVFTDEETSNAADTVPLDEKAWSNLEQEEEESDSDSDSDSEFEIESSHDEVWARRRLV